MYLFLGILIMVTLIICLSFFMYFTNNEKLIYWIAIISVFVPVNYVNRYFIKLPAIAKWLPFVALVMCFTILLLRQIMSRKTFFSSRLAYFLILLMVFSFISLIYNHASFLPAVFSGIGLLSYIFYLFILNNKQYHLSTNELLILLVKFSVASAFVAFFQRIFLVTLLNRSSDMITGLFSVDGQFTFYQLFCLIITLVYWFFNKPITSRISNFTIAVILMASVAISGNVASLFFLPLIFSSIFFFVEKRLFFNKFRSFFFLFLLLVGATFLYSALWKTEKNRSQENTSLFELVTNPTYLHDYFFGMDYKVGSDISKSGSLKRGSALVFAYVINSRSQTTLMLGKGPGATSEAELPGATGSIGKKFPGYKVNRTSYSQVIAELGMGGLLFLALFLVTLYQWKSDRTEYQGVLIIRKVTVLVLLIFLAYENVFNDLSASLILAVLTLTTLQHKKVKPVQNKTAVLQHAT